MNRVVDESDSAETSLRVLLVSSSSGSHGGGELYLVGLAEGLLDAGHEVHVAMSGHQRMDQLAELLEPFASVHRLPLTNTYDRRLRGFGSLFDRGASKCLPPLVAKLQPDVVHLNKQNLEDGLDLLRVLARLSVPLVSTIHVTRSAETLGATGGTVRDHFSRLVLRSERFHTICVAHRCRQDFLEFMAGCDRDTTCFAVPNGVDAAPVADRIGIRGAWNCSNHDFVLGTVARIEDQKNPLMAAEILAKLDARYRFIWIGDGRLRGELEQRIETLGLQDRFLIAGWRSDARQLLAGFDAFVLPSRYEGFPFAILEAMAAGLPCVVSAVDGVAEAVQDQRTGFVCDGESLPQWVSRIEQLGDSQEQLATFGQAAWSRWRDCFSLTSMASGTLRVYRSAMASGTQQGAAIEG